MVAKNWRSLLIEVTISKRLFVVMPENGIFCEFGFPNGILWEFSLKNLSSESTIASASETTEASTQLS